MNIPWSYRAGYRVLLHRVDGDIDITDRILSLTINTGDVSAIGTGSLGSDAVVSTATIELDGAQPFLAPEAHSPLNHPRALLRPYRRVTVLAAEPGQQMQTLFTGFLGDSTATETRSSTRRVTVTARDIAKPFQDSFIVGNFPTLGGTSATIESVLQQLIDMVPAEFRPDLVIPTPPDLLLESSYRPSDTTVWDVMQQLVMRMGWYLGARGNNLILLEPPRGDDVPDVALDADDVFEDTQTISDTDVRNKITIQYNASGGSVTHEDTHSITDITDGIVKHSLIKFSSDSPIRTAAAADSVAQAFLHDMSRPHAITRFVMPFKPSVTVFTRVGLRNPWVSSHTRLVAVTSVQHQIQSGGKARTVVLGSERVIGGHQNWLRQETKPGGG